MSTKKEKMEMKEYFQANACRQVEIYFSEVEHELERHLRELNRYRERFREALETEDIQTAGMTIMWTANFVQQFNTHSEKAVDAALNFGRCYLELKL